MVREFQSVIGSEVKRQSEGLQVEAMIACVGGGSNAIGFFSPFIELSNLHSTERKQGEGVMHRETMPSA